MFLFLIGFLLPFFFGGVHSDSVLYLREVHSMKILTRDHTFLDQLCLPDEHLHIPIEYIMAKVVFNLNPPKLRVRRKYLDTATGLKLIYSEDMGVKVHIWAQVYESYTNVTRHHSLKNSTLTQIETASKTAECVDIRYYTPFIGDEKSDRVQIDYKIEVYWVKTSFSF